MCPQRGMSDSSSNGPDPLAAPVKISDSVFVRLLRPYRALPAAVLILCFGSFLNRAGSFVLLFMTIYVSEQMQFGVTFAASCFGAFGAGCLIASMVGGQLADRFGRKVIMLLALSGGIVSILLLSTADSRAEFLILMFAFSVTMEMYRPAASAMISDLAGTQERPHAFGLMYIAYNLGFAVAAPLGGFLAEHSFQWLFIGDAMTTGLYAILIALFISETSPAGTSDALEADSEPQFVSWSAAIHKILQDTTFLLFSLAVLLTSIVFMQAFSTLPIHLSQLGYSKEEIGLLLSVNGLLIVFLQIPFTNFLNRFHRIVVILLGELLIAVGFGLTTFAVIKPMILMTIVIWTTGEVIQASFKQTVVADLAPQDMRGRYMGAFGFCHAVGLTIGAPAGGWILEHYGADALWPLSALCSFASAGVYALVYRRLRHGDDQQTA